MLVLLQWQPAEERAALRSSRRHVPSSNLHLRSVDEKRTLFDWNRADVPKVAPGELVELRIVECREIDRASLSTSLVINVQVWIVMEDPLDLHVRVLVDPSRLLEEAFDLWEPVEPSSHA